MQRLVLTCCALALACSGEQAREICDPPSGTYAVRWLHVPEDCLPLSALTELELSFDSGCAAKPLDTHTAACAIQLDPRGTPCEWPFDHGYVSMQGLLLRTPDGHFEGDVSGIALRDGAGPPFGYARFCRGWAHIEIGPGPIDGGGPSLPEAVTAEAGSECLASCDEGLLCAAKEGEPGGLGVCRALPVEGEPCATEVSGPRTPFDNFSPLEPLLCAPDTYCDTTRACRAYPTKAGEPCGLGVVPSMTYCPRDTYCSADGVCLPLPGAGEPCTASDFEPCDDGEGCCLPGLWCDEVRPEGGPICTPYGKRGEPCETGLQGNFRDTCEQLDLVCECTDASCTARACFELRGAKARCDAPFVTCESGLFCVAGVCERRP